MTKHSDELEGIGNASPLIDNLSNSLVDLSTEYRFAEATLLDLERAKLDYLSATSDEERQVALATTGIQMSGQAFEHLTNMIAAAKVRVQGFTEQYEGMLVCYYGCTE